MNWPLFIDTARKKPVWTSFVLCLVLFVPVFIFCNPRYETNDDLFMNGIVSGFFAGKPDAHLPYSHFVIGLILSGLFKYSALLNWYALYLSATHVISWFILFYVFLRQVNHWAIPLAAIGLFVWLEPLFYTQLQFTTTAALAGVSGMALIFTAFQQEKTRLLNLIAGMAMLLFSFMIRDTSAYLSILLCAVPFIAFRKWKRMLRPALTGCVVLMLMLILQWSNKRYYQTDSKWFTYFQEIKIGNRFNDNPAFYEELVNSGKDVQALNGWNRNDLLLFSAFFRNYSPVYPIQSYEALYNQYTQFKPLPWRDFLYLFRTSFGLPVVLLLFVLLFWLYGTDGRIKMLMQVVLLAFLAWFIYASLQLKERALLSMLLAFSLGLLLMYPEIQKPAESPEKPLRPWAIPGLLVLLILFSGWYAQEQKRRKIKSETERQSTLCLNLLETMRRHANTWFLWGPSLPLESLSPWKHSFTWKNREPVLYPIAVFNKHPLMQEAFHQPFEKLLSDSNSRILSMHEPWVSFTPERLDTFYLQHLNCRLIHGGDSTDAASGRRIFWFKACEVNQQP